MQNFLPLAIQKRLPNEEDLRMFVSPIFSGSDPNVLTVKLEDGSITVSGSFTGESRPASGTHSLLAANTASAVFQVANLDRRGWTCYNDSTTPLFLKLGPSASTASFTVRLIKDAYYELPFPIYTGEITGFWAVSGSGNAKVTELTP